MKVLHINSEWTRVTLERLEIDGWWSKARGVEPLTLIRLRDLAGWKIHFWPENATEPYNT